MRLPERDLPHRPTLHGIGRVAGDGTKTYQAGRAVPALVIMTETLVRDERPDSPTKGDEITTSATLITNLENYVPPGSLVDILQGTPAARKVEVVAAHYNDHPIAPSSAKLFLK